MRLKKNTLGIATIALTTALAVSMATPASASDQDSSSQALAALGGLNLLADASGTSSAPATGEVSTDGGVSVETATGTVSMRPATESEGTVAEAGSAVVFDGGVDHAFAMTGSGSAADAGYIVITGAGAPTTFSFEVTADGSAASLEQTPDGGVLVKNAAGEVVNILGAAWALDARGAALKTWYSVSEGLVVQHVDHAGASYPVVADPRLMCDGVFCTMEYTRAETQTLANWSGTAGTLITAGCTKLGGVIGGLACGIAAGVISSMASQALSQNKCFGMRAFIYVPMSTTHAVTVNCYA